MPRSSCWSERARVLRPRKRRDRRDWKVRGPYCEGWPDLPRGARPGPGTIYAAAASEWHGAGVWRSTDLGESWELSSEGLAYGDDGLKLSKISGLTAAHGRVLAGAEAAGVFESRDGGETWSLLSTLDGQPGRERLERPGQAAAGPPRPARRSSRTRTSRHRFWAVVQGIGIFETTDDGASWTPRNTRAARRLAARAPRGRLLRPQARDVAGRPRPPVPAEPLRHAPQRRRRPLVDGDHRRPAVRLRLRRGGASPRPRQLLRDPARPGPRPLHARGPRGRLADERRRRDAGGGSTAGCRSRTRTSACCARGSRSTRWTCPGSTSARAPARCSRAPTRARAGARSRATCRRSRRSRWRWSPSHGRRCTFRRRCRRSSASLPRRLEVDAATVEEAIERSTSRWPGLRDRLCEPGPVLRPHINVYVDRERAELDTPLDARSRVDVIAAISGG